MPKSSYTVAIVEDEPVLRQELAFQLEHLGFDIQAFDSVEACYRYLAVGPRTLLVLDIGLEGEDGLSACRDLRAHEMAVGIVFFTARRLHHERIAGLEAGADAYLVKPIDPLELSAILNNLGHRLYGTETNRTPEQDIGSHWLIDPKAGVLMGPEEIRVPLSRDDERLLEALLEHPDDTCPTVGLAAALGMLPDDLHKHRIEVIISRLRRRVLQLTGRQLPLRSVRGVGYRLS
ncbi:MULTISPECIES: response regulator transcription factor [unclassified Thiocapsa]|uniref:response regulator transcription factor n=1 Tax=unclassified Thiocapsa TaxID=2641286 RepID=UPI0035B422B3